MRAFLLAFVVLLWKPEGGRQVHDMSPTSLVDVRVKHKSQGPWSCGRDVQISLFDIARVTPETITVTGSLYSDGVFKLTDTKFNDRHVWKLDRGWRHLYDKFLFYNDLGNAGRWVISTSLSEDETQFYEMTPPSDAVIPLGVMFFSKARTVSFPKQAQATAVFQPGSANFSKTHFGKTKQYQIVCRRHLNMFLYPALEYQVVHQVGGSPWYHELLLTPDVTHSICSDPSHGSVLHVDDEMRQALGIGGAGELSSGQCLSFRSVESATEGQWLGELKKLQDKSEEERNLLQKENENLHRQIIALENEKARLSKSLEVYETQAEGLKESVAYYKSQIKSLSEAKLDQLETTSSSGQQHVALNSKTPQREIESVTGLEECQAKLQQLIEDTADPVKGMPESWRKIYLSNEERLMSLEDELAKLEAQRTGRMQDVDNVNLRIAKVEADILEIQRKKTNSHQVLASLNDQIKDLESALVHGQRVSATVLLQSSSEAEEDAAPRAVQIRLQPRSQSSHTVSVSSGFIEQVSHSKMGGTPWREAYNAQRQAMAEKESEVQRAHAAIKNEDARLAEATENLRKAQMKKAAEENDITYLDIRSQIDKLEERRDRLKLLVDSGYAILIYKLRQLEIASRRNPEMARLLERLIESQSGKAGLKRKEAFEANIAAGHDRDTIQADFKRLQHYCKATHAFDSASDMGGKISECSQHQIQIHFDKMLEEVQSLMAQAKSDVQTAMTSPSEMTLSAKRTIPLVDKQIGHLSDLLHSWQLEDPVRFNEPLWMKYLNWVEDTESAVRVYIKVTNRERAANSPSNSLLACAEQVPDLPYVPDRMIRFADCDSWPVWRVSPEAGGATCADHDTWDQHHKNDMYGPFYGVYASSDHPDQISFSNNIPNKDVYGYQKGPDETFDWAPHMRQVVRQAQSGYTVVLFGYGYSGSGKTFTLLGNGKTPGVMTLGLQEMQHSIKGISVRFKELYGQISLEDGRPEVGETGLYSYKIDVGDDAMPIARTKCPDGFAASCVESKFWGRSDVAPGEIFVPPMSDGTNPPNYKPKPDEVADKGFREFLELQEHTMELNMNRVVEGNHTVAEWLQSALEMIQVTRQHQTCRTQDGEEVCRHVRATPNNPESSRGHLFIMLDVTFKAHEDDEDQSDKVGRIVIVDCAGSEEPVSIMKDYVNFGDGAVGDKRAMRYLKAYDRRLSGNLKLWNSLEMDDITPTEKKRTWMLEAAREWADALPTDLTVGNPDAGGPEGVTWKKFKKGDRFEPFKSRGKDDSAKDGELLKTWSEYFLYAHGIIAMVKEGVFINESLNQLKQFLLKRAGRIESLLHLMGEKGHTSITNRSTVVPDTSNPVLPILNDWDYDKANEKPFLDTLATKANERYDPAVSSYHPKQFIKPWDTRLVGHRGGFQSRKEAKNSESLLGSARCSFNWANDPLTPDTGGKPFSCDGMLVDGVPAQKKHLQKGAIPRFDPMIMMSLLNYLDHPEYFGGAKRQKPTKFLMVAAVRREHPKDESDPPLETTAQSFKRLKRNICKGTEMTLSFADEMNPLSRKFSQLDQK